MIWAEEDGKEETKQEDGLTIGGDILFEKTGNIHIFLVTEENFTIPFTGIQKKVLTIGQEEREQRNVSFTFNGIQPGIYGIRCFQDVNDNGKLDRGLFGPKEPWGMSWQGDKPAKWPKFKHISFEVTTDITSITIDVK
jgi:uncharacterized protein (DUF2141 family)